MSVKISRCLSMTSYVAYFRAWRGAQEDDGISSKSSLRASPAINYNLRSYLFVIDRDYYVVLPEEFAGVRHQCCHGSLRPLSTADVHCHKRSVNRQNHNTRFAREN